MPFPNSKGKDRCIFSPWRKKNSLTSTLLLTQFFWDHLGRRGAEIVLCCSFVGQQRNPDDSLLRTRKHPLPALHLLLQNEEGVTQESKRARGLLETKEKLAAPFIVQKAPSFDRSEAKVSKTQAVGWQSCTCFVWGLQITRSQLVKYWRGRIKETGGKLFWLLLLGFSLLAFAAVSPLLPFPPPLFFRSP